MFDNGSIIQENFTFVHMSKQLNVNFLAILLVTIALNQAR